MVFCKERVTALVVVAVTTLKRAYGFAAPLPTLPSASTVKMDEVAEPEALVEDAILKRRCCEPYAPCRESLAYAVVVPIERDLLVLFHSNVVASALNAPAPLEN